MYSFKLPCFRVRKVRRDGREIITFWFSNGFCHVSLIQIILQLYLSFYFSVKVVVYIKYIDHLWHKIPRTIWLCVDVPRFYNVNYINIIFHGSIQENMNHQRRKKQNLELKFWYSTRASITFHCYISVGSNWLSGSFCLWEIWIALFFINLTALLCIRQLPQLSVK